MVKRRSAPVRAALALSRALGVALATLLLVLAWALVLMPAGLVGRLVRAVRPARRAESYWLPVAPARGDAPHLDPY